MIAGTVGVRLEATIPLLVFGTGPRQQTIRAAIDTGYNGALTLPAAVVRALSLTRLVPGSATLANGTQRPVHFFRAHVLWDGQIREVRILCVDADPLIGTALLKGYHLGIDFVDGGAVAIDAIP
jgi:clan AA aspartic protease